MSMRRIDRILRLIKCLLSGQCWSLKSLCGELEVSRRTIFRDLAVLRQAGLTYYVDRERNGLVIERIPKVRNFNLNIQEAMALLLILRANGLTKIIPYGAAAQSAARKLESSLPEPLALQCKKLLQNTELNFGPMSDVESISGLLARLLGVAAERRKVEVTYEASSGIDEITTALHIYKLVFMRRSWYAIGYSELHQTTRTIKVERILDVVVLDGSFVADPQFTLDRYLGSAWQMLRGDQQHHVVIYFAPWAADEIDAVAWHPTQQTRPQNNGAITLEVDVDGLDEIVWWVLGFGNGARVLEPPELREMIKEHIRAMRTMYS